MAYLIQGCIIENRRLSLFLGVKQNRVIILVFAPSWVSARCCFNHLGSTELCFGHKSIEVRPLFNLKILFSLELLLEIRLLDVL